MKCMGEIYNNKYNKGEMNIKITELKHKESGLHYYNKKYLLDWIIDKSVIFKDLYDNYFYINIDNFEFCSQESYVYEHSEASEPYHSGHCGLCYTYKKKKFNSNTKYFNKDDTYKIIKVNYYEQLLIKNHKLSQQRFLYDSEAWKENIIYNPHKDNLFNQETFFRTHPCNFCKYKGVTECILIFDIAFAHEGKIELALEIKNTSPAKWNKIKFCKENNITLIQIDAKEIVRANFTLRDKKFVSCEMLNISNRLHGIHSVNIK